MTPVQKALAEGFTVSLDTRGVWLEVTPGGRRVKGIVETSTPDNAEFAVDRVTAVRTRISVLRSAIRADCSNPELEIGIGAVFRDPTAAVSHRVVEIDDSPASVCVRFLCETALATSDTP